MKCEINKNYIEVCGSIVNDVQFEHKINDKKYYKCYIDVTRLSGYKDFLPLYMEENNIGLFKDCIGKTVRIKGKIRSHNIEDLTGRHLKVYILVEECLVEEEELHNNYIHLEGYICKPPVYKKTSKGKDVSEMILAVNRAFHKSDYIPCICWQEEAMIAADLKVGTKCEIEGRFQSREYLKKINGTKEKRIAFEVSIRKLMPQCKGEEEKKDEIQG